MAREILVVEDEANIALSLEFLMEQAGYRVRTAADGESALAAIAASPPDLVLLDVRMPKLSGISALERIRVLEPDIPALLCSGYLGEEDISSVSEVPVITKPFDRARLLDTVRASLEGTYC